MEDSLNKTNLVFPKADSKTVQVVVTDDFSFDWELEENQKMVLEMVISGAKETPLTVMSHVKLAKGAAFKAVIVDFSSQDDSVSISGEGKEDSSFTADIACAAKGKEKKKYDIRIVHAYGPSYSLVKMYGVITDQASLQFLGTSDIKKGARKTWTRQEGRIADLSSGGHGEVSPVLKIAEDDVKASHGAALGKIPEESLFYLMSRGLSKKEAMGLITLGYLKPIIMELSDKKTKDGLLTELEKRNFIND